MGIKSINALAQVLISLRGTRPAEKRWVRRLAGVKQPLFPEPFDVHARTVRRKKKKTLESSGAQQTECKKRGEGRR